MNASTQQGNAMEKFKGLMITSLYQEESALQAQLLLPVPQFQDSAMRKMAYVAGIVLLALLQITAAQSCNPMATADSFLLQCGCTAEALEGVKEELKKDVASIKDEITSQKLQVASLRKEILENLRTLKFCHGIECVCKHQLGKNTECPADSCKQILDEQPKSRSDYYWLKACESCEPFTVFCDFNLTLEGTKGWMRVADLDMTDHSQQCPSQFKLIASPRRLCGRKTDASGCDSTIFETYNTHYRKVAGRAIGYQIRWPESFDCSDCHNINKPYVDGISITNGYPRNHIWTYAAGGACPCAIGNTQQQPSFVGNDYYCEYGGSFSDPLWDGEGCSDRQLPCCQSVRDSLGWFIKELSTPTTDDIEVRICADESLANEDIGLERIEIYIQ